MDGPDDWPNGQRPATCCHTTREGAAPVSEKQCQQADSKIEYLYSDGCFSKLQSKVDSNARVLIGVGIGIAFVEVRKAHMENDDRNFPFACKVNIFQSQQMSFFL